LTPLFLAFFVVMSAASQSKDAANYVHFTWEKVAEGVWFGITPPNSFIGGNTVIIAIPPNGAFVVDPHITESTANEIIAKAKEVAGPVRYLVNTHFHNDHSQGNSAFRKAFPDIQIIAHRNTCWAEKEKALPRSRYRLGKLPEEVEEMKANLNRISDAKIKADLAHLIAGNEVYLQDSKHLEWVYPDVCLDLAPGEAKKMSLGGREIQIHYFGRAHTAGDLVVYLPKERIIANGDLWGGTGSFFDFGRDGSGLEYAGTLRGIATLDYDTALPGHGEVIHGTTALYRSVLAVEQLVNKVKRSYALGQYIEQTLAEIPAPQRSASAGPTLASYVPYMSAPAQAGWNRNLIRIYEELEMRKQRGIPVP